MTVRVRFAPSPTGYLHIGGARTALYNFLFARHEKGTLVLRIEDTDLERNTEASYKSIFDGLEWLGLKPDEGPYYQSKRLDLYRRYAEQLEKAGRTYWKEDPDKGRGLYFRIESEKVVWPDVIHGASARDPAGEGDLVLLKSNGFPTYNFACVVDDHEMGISHVIRGDEHYNNTPKQIQVYRALGWEPPLFGHIPLIFDPKGEKISKRKTYDFPVTIEECRAMGYLPEAFVNFIALLGWSPGQNIELMTLDEMIGHFTLDRVGSSPARFSHEKLHSFNGHYIRKAPLDRIVALCRPALEKAYDLSGVPGEKIREAVRQQQERLKTLSEIAALTRFFFVDEVTYDPKAVEKWIKAGDGRDVLAELRGALSAMGAFEKEPVERLLKTVSEKRQLKLGKVAQPLRVAVTGGDASPPMHETLGLLGRERVLARIDRALAMP
jgi:glutamyl-tRNA synthetase